MKHYLIDTNFLLRYLLNDIAEQATIARKYFVEAKLQKITITVPVVVIVEVLFNLIKLYRYKKEKVVEILGAFIQLPYLEIEKRAVLLRALLLYGQSAISFVDVLLFVEAQLTNKELLTFDKKLTKLRN